MSYITDPERFREADELLGSVEVPEPEPEPEIKHLLLPHRMRQPDRPDTWCGTPRDGENVTSWPDDPGCCCECLERRREWAS